MMDSTTIASLNRRAARQASREHRYPTIVEQEDIDYAKAALVDGRNPRLDIPFIGEWHPRGYATTDNLYFVDSSGFGTRGERALTQGEFLDNLRPGFAYAIVEAGQFQVYVQEYKVRTYARRRGDDA